MNKLNLSLLSIIIFTSSNLFALNIGYGVTVKNATGKEEVKDGKTKYVDGKNIIVTIETGAKSISLKPGESKFLPSKSGYRHLFWQVKETDEHYRTFNPKISQPANIEGGISEYEKKGIKFEELKNKYAHPHEMTIKGDGSIYDMIEKSGGKILDTQIDKTAFDIKFKATIKERVEKFKNYIKSKNFDKKIEEIIKKKNNKTEKDQLKSEIEKIIKNLKNTTLQINMNIETLNLPEQPNEKKDAIKIADKTNLETYRDTLNSLMFDLNIKIAKIKGRVTTKKTTK